MGCGITLPNKNAFPDIRTKRKYEDLKLSDSTKTAADQVDLQENSKKPSKICSNILPAQIDGVDILNAYELLQSLEISCADDFKSLKETTSSFLSLYSSFLYEIHACCIPRFRLSKGLKVLMASVYAQQSSNEDLLVICNKFPYFKVLPQSKAQFATIGEVLYLSKHVKKNDGFLKDLLRLEYVLKVLSSDEGLLCGIEEGVKVLKESVEEGRRVLKIVDSIFEECKLFFRDYWSIKEEAIKVGKEFLRIEGSTCEDIVHFMYLESLIRC